MGNIRWDYDLKKDILGDDFNEEYHIINILNARKSDNHVENSKQVKDIYKVLFNQENQYKDIMNSFWNTYKCMLQIEYPLIFAPQKEINKSNVLKKDKDLIKKLRDSKIVMQGRTPFSKYKDGPTFPQEFVDYYNNNFPLILENENDDKEKYKYNIKLDVSINYKWIDFLLCNFDKFPLVHRHETLNHFAKLTHTIGNITVVPKGFNTGRNAGDYWDYGMKYLYEFLNPISDNTWKSFIDKYELHEYVYDEIPHSKAHPIIPFWEGHLDPNAYATPQDIKQIEKFLSEVIPKIEKRGKKLIKRYNKAKSKV